MALSNEKVSEYMKRLLLSRMRILCNHGFYGLLLMHMIYSIDESAKTAYTDGMRIAFSPEFLDDLSDSELDFVMMHEIMHVVLQHVLRGENRDHERFNIACDIVVNSNIMLENGKKLNSITLSKYGESMHIAPDGKEGYEYTAEEVYDMLPPSPPDNKDASGERGNEPGKSKQKQTSGNASEKGRAKKIQAQAGNVEKTTKTWDDHSRWGEIEDESVWRDVWVKQFAETCEAISIRDSSDSRGTLPMFAKRILEELKDPQTDWRTILNDFIQEEINDYSFSPPDRRFQDSPFFLPDFNEMGESDEVKDILFMIDTSGSMSDQAISAAYSEIKGAIDQFNGRLQGWLGFFDAAIIEPKPFSNFDEFIRIQAAGGGGTDFHIIFEYVEQYMQDHLPVSIIILTDGDAPFPEEDMAKGIPILWLLNNEDVNPPWGKVARIKI